jgi:hypothetical protein
MGVVADLRMRGPGSISGDWAMWDIGMLAIGVAFFTIAILYVKGCELLVKKEPAK